MVSTARQELLSLADRWGLAPNSAEYALRLDLEDPLRGFRERFSIPKMVDLKGVDPAFIQSPDQECIYLCGHIFGLKPKDVDVELLKVLNDWGMGGKQCFTEGYLPASHSDQFPKQLMADIVGADRDEIVFMNGCIVNLHLLMMTYYRPQGRRCKMVVEADAFSGGLFAAESQVSHHGLDLETDLILLRPRKGEALLREEDIYELIEREGETVAMLLLSGVQFHTGQALDMRGITSAAREKGCVVLWDIAHAVCNVELKLNEWKVDLAAWCTYKYMNCGPGTTGVAYVRHEFRKACGLLPELRGWWGNNVETRLASARCYDPSPSADMFKVSVGSSVLIAPIMTSLKIFSEMGETRRLRKQFLLTGYLELLLLDELCASYVIEDSTRPFYLVTPSDTDRRGSQLSVRVAAAYDPACVVQQLLRRGVVCDTPAPSLLRFTPAAPYNSFGEAYRCAQALRECCAELCSCNGASTYNNGR
ncbi:kynureninase-like [Amblyomma americanum]